MATDLLLITAASSKGVITSGVTIQVQVNGRPASVEFDSVRLPASPRPLRVEVTLDPGVPHLFGARGTFLYHGEGRLEPQDEGAQPPHFRPVRVARIENQSAAMSLIGYVSRVRDVTARVLDVIRAPPPERAGFKVPSAWRLASRLDRDA